MPAHRQDYDASLFQGKNKGIIKCKFCSSIILAPSSATLATFEFNLPLIKQAKGNEINPDIEEVSLFWAVNDMLIFYNVGFSHTVGTIKYLTCADCEAGPIGYHDITNKMNYVALTRVQHMPDIEDLKPE